MADWHDNDQPTPPDRPTPQQGKPAGPPQPFDLDAFLDSLDAPKPPAEASASPPDPAGGRSRRARQRIAARHKDGPKAPLQPTGQASARRRDAPRPLPVQLPTLNRASMMRWLYVGGALVLLIGVVVGLGLFKSEEPVSYPNALWVGSEWSYTPRSAAELAEFAARLRQYRIGTVYAYVGYLKGDNAWSGRRAGSNTFDEVQADVAAFVGQFRLAYPQARLMGWLGVPNDLDVSAGEPYRINSPEVRAEIARMSARLISDFGFDGVILNVEPMPERDSSAFITLLQAVRREMGDSGRLAVTMFADIAPSDLTVPRNQRAIETNAIAEYTTGFKQRVALLTDEIMVMAYNSSLTDAPDYVEWVAHQTQSYALAMAELEAGAQVYIGIPTYDDQGVIHLASVENVSTAIEGVLRGKQRAGTAATAITGVAIYAEWTTSEDEWRLFGQFWKDGS